jgi:hypothetical protein
VDLHPVEAAWRRFRKSERMELLKTALELQRRRYRDAIGLKALPSEVVLSGSVAWHLIAVDEARARDNEAGEWISANGAMLGNTLHVWAAYRESKTIYEVEPALAECLSRSPWPRQTPTAALRLRSRCPVLSIPRGNTMINLAATYSPLIGAEESSALELRISRLENDLWVAESILHLTRENLGECVEAAAAIAGVHGTFEKTARLWGDTTAGLALTLQLYLGGDPDVVRIVHAGERPAVKGRLERADPERFRDLRDPNTYAVGRTFARAIERWEIEHLEDAGMVTGKTVRPHMRRAHSHLYWTGKGREIPRVRFLLPVSVRGGKLVEEPEHPTETKVR